MTRTRAEIVAEVEHQLDGGAAALTLPPRLGYDRPDSLRRLLYRAGRADLARLMPRSDQDREYDARHRFPCRTDGCAAQCGRKNKTGYCYRCSRGRS